MAEIELNVDAMLVPELLALAAGVASALEDNAHFPNPEPNSEELMALTRNVTAAEEAWRAQRALAVQAKVELDKAADALRAGLTLEATYVQKQSGGEIAKILSANMHVEEGTSFWPFNRMGQVEELSASMGDQPGEIDLSWDPVANASGYEVEVAYDLNGEGPWEQSGATTQSRITIENLSNRTRYWFRVRAVSDSGAGDWSESATKFAP